ncbi:hypothetical protein [Tellurirhabdus rosea]|uniref:hypothetical protein n=1 Tax=Tellurirhabdus rosea TaxID=2674997 RepID=UPI00225609FB|nr:hypothetical protein [Tellurirhabdus rosea]
MAPADGNLFKFISRDYIISMISMGLAVLDSRVNLSALDNRAAPEYTATSETYRTVTIENANTTLAENYFGAPFYSLRGDSVAEYTNTVTVTGNSVDVATANSSSSKSLTDFSISDVTNFIESNLLWIAIGAGVLLYFDPFGWFGKKKKKK